MEYSPILAPVVALVAWTLVVLLWMVTARGGAFRRMGVTLGTIPPGSRGVHLDGRGEDQAQWKSHNYNHLMEQPTIFYAMALTLALMGIGTGMNLWLAWGYVGFRIIHSLIQCTVNVVRYRLLMFLLATFCLMGMTLNAGLQLLRDCGLI
jgi:hypothetical protein